MLFAAAGVVLAFAALGFVAFLDVSFFAIVHASNAGQAETMVTDNGPTFNGQPGARYAYEARGRSAARGKGVIHI